MQAESPSQKLFSLESVILILLLLQLLVFAVSNAHAAPFTFPQPGFQQPIVGVTLNCEGGVAFAPDGDVQN